MSKKLISVPCILMGLLALIVGIAAGFLIKGQMDTPKIEKADAVVKVMSSNLIPSLTVYGEVKEISGRNITLSYVGDTLTVPIKDDAKILAIQNDDPAGAAKEVTLGDVKVGDFLNITLVVSREGIVEGTQVLIIPFVQGI